QGLVCNFRVDMKEIGNRWRIDFAQYFADEMSLLAEMERDGLVEVHPDDITVNTAGRLLVRIICMVFDCYQQPGMGELLSKTV
ncbi:MAG: hypothetical protein OER87_15075, partial [Gammaproteobacteria bacterium]|nr:hypothetical protein [Gammaproteobacteria bacterium]